MTPIPMKIRKMIDTDSFYKTCALHGIADECEGRITMDHSVQFKGNQIQKLWAITPVCAKHHGVDGYKDSALLKEMRLWVAINRASDEELFSISKAINYQNVKSNLNSRFGTYNRPFAI